MPAIKNIQQKLDKEISTLLKPSLEKPKGSTNKTPKLTYEGFLADKVLIIAAIKKGIPYSLFELIQEYAPFSESEWAKFLHISTKSLQRYKLADKPFKPDQSERIIDLAELVNTGLMFFGDMEDFKLWLIIPNIPLGRVKPVELLSDSFGRSLIRDELTRMYHGIFV